MKVKLKGSDEEFELTKIAGRGKLGDMNWGADFNRPEKVVLKEHEELKKHIGEPVVLTGGGGWVWYVGVLKGIKIDEIDGKKIVRAHITNLDMPIGGKHEFSPLLDSWQISVFDKPDRVREILHL